MPSKLNQSIQWHITTNCGHHCDHCYMYDPLTWPAERRDTLSLGDLFRILDSFKIDRPLGGRHPEHGFIYPVNYGYLPDTLAPDGQELDAYVLGVFEPQLEFEGRCIAVVRRLDDDDDKLIVAPEGKEFTDDQIQALTEIQERLLSVCNTP